MGRAATSMAGSTRQRFTRSRISRSRRRTARSCSTGQTPPIPSSPGRSVRYKNRLSDKPHRRDTRSRQGQHARNKRQLPAHGPVKGVTYYYCAYTHDGPELLNRGSDERSSGRLPRRSRNHLPRGRSTITTLTPTIQWTSETQQYKVHISQVNNPNTSTNGWDSGPVGSSGNCAVSGTLWDYSIYYVFVRVHNAVRLGRMERIELQVFVNTNTDNGVSTSATGFLRAVAG